MTQDRRSLAPSDAELVAYLDGELSPADSVRIGQTIAADRATAERLDLLMKGARPFRESFEPLLSVAPRERLERMLTGVLLQGSAPRRPLRGVVARFWPAAAVAACALLAIGAGVDRLVLAPPGRAESAPVPPGGEVDEWRQVVADYLSLYTGATLSTATDPAAGSQERLAGIGNRLGVELTPARAALPELTLRRAETLDYDGMPLAFLAYLGPRDEPISLCIIAGVAGNSPPRTERRRGLNIVYWSRDRHGFMLVGRAGADQLQGLAALVAHRFLGRQDSGTADQPG